MMHSNPAHDRARLTHQLRAIMERQRKGTSAWSLERAEREITERLAVQWGIVRAELAEMEAEYEQERQNALSTRAA